MIPFLDGFVNSFGFGGGQAMGTGLLDMSLSPINATMDSLGLSQHGRDQYFNANLQREFLEKQMQFQREMLGYNQNFTKEMYDRQWNDMLSKYPELAQKLNDQQFNLWKNQFQMQNQWNSPGNQQMLLMAAGRNPVANAQGMIGSSSMGASSAATPPQISPTPFQGSGSPIGLPQGMSGRGTTLSDVGSFLKDLASAKKLGVETDQLEKLFGYEVQERANRIFGQELVNDSISLQNYVLRNTKDVKVRRATEELLKVVAETENVDADTALKIEERFNKECDSLLKIAQKNLAEKDYEMLKMRVQNYQTEWKITMDNLRSQSQANRSQAALNNALAQTENDLRQGKITAQRLGNNILSLEEGLKTNELWINDNTKVEKVRALMAQFAREGFITQQEKEKAYQLSVASEWAERQEFVKFVMPFINAVGNVLNGGLNAYSHIYGKELDHLDNHERNVIQNAVQSERNRILNDYFEDKKSTNRSAVLGPEWEMYSDQWK